MRGFIEPIVDEFDRGKLYGIIRRDDTKEPIRFIPNYKIGINGKLHGWWSAEFTTVEECRAFLEKFIEKKTENLKASQEQAVKTRQRRKEEKIAKVVRAYLLGKHIGNLESCAICHRKLSDPVSIERGIGSECWPNLLDRLCKEVPRCEEAIKQLICDIAEAEEMDNLAQHPSVFARMV